MSNRPKPAPLFEAIPDLALDRRVNLLFWVALTVASERYRTDILPANPGFPPTDPRIDAYRIVIQDLEDVIGMDAYLRMEGIR